MIALSPHVLVRLLISLFALAVFSRYKPLQANNSEAFFNSSAVLFLLRSLKLISKLISCKEAVSICFGV